ncbi:RpiB/LacA/LacB family sugar-phosphate isomerase [Candidatus Nomurabacteria bacterium]|nr:RpiB/LacA/LacB family sugar-phosphate isomerase [Candidatus Nomurabacteria bacterium]
MNKHGIVYIGADHQGFRLKAKLKEYLESAGFEVIDTGDTALNPEDDFPVFASKLVHALFADRDREAKGILICGSGQGMAIAANRFKGIRAAVLDTVEEARLARNDDDINVLALPAIKLNDNPQLMRDIVDTYLATPFESIPKRLRRNKLLDELN